MLTTTTDEERGKRSAKKVRKKKKTKQKKIQNPNKLLFLNDKINNNTPSSLHETSNVDSRKNFLCWVGGPKCSRSRVPTSCRV